MFSKFSFKTKLLALCFLLCGVSVAVGVIGFFGLKEVTGQYGFIMEKTMPKSELVNKMFLEYRRVRITLRTLGLPGISQKDAEEAIKGAYEAIAGYEEARKAYEDLGFIPGQKEQYDKLDQSWAGFKETGARVIALYKTGKPEDFKKMLDIFMTECPERAKVYTANVNGLLKFHNGIAEKKVAGAKSAAETANTSALIAILVGVLVGLSFGFIFATAVSRSINQIIERLSENATQVSSASSQIASSSEELSQAATEQASSLEETAASLEEINSMIAKASESAETTASSSTESQQKAEQGRTAVDQMLNSMTEISDSNEAIMAQVNESNHQMAEIVRVIQEIGNKTKVINEIVFQTKLLSFNASVEAARAGEHGKGFAVVAEEVGNLAQMSGNAAKEISEMLDGSISKVDKIVEETKTKVEALIERGKQKVQSGTNVANQCSEVLNEILQNVTKVSRLSQEISQASREQAQGVTEINKAMGQLDTVTQQNSATSEEAASAAEELSAQAEALKSVVDELVSVMRGSAGHATPVATSHKITKKADKAGSNVRPLKPVAKAPVTVTAPKAVGVKAASGEMIPSRDDAGFRDV